MIFVPTIALMMALADDLPAAEFWKAQEPTPIRAAPQVAEPGGLTLEANLLLGYMTFKGQIDGGVGVETGARYSISSKAYTMLHYRFMHVHDQEDTSGDTGLFATPGFGEITTDTMDFHDVLLGIGVMAQNGEKWGLDLQIETGARYATIHRTMMTVQNDINVSRDDQSGSGWAIPVVAAVVGHYHALPELNLNLGFWMDAGLLHGFGSNHGVEVGFGLQLGLEGRF